MAFSRNAHTKGVDTAEHVRLDEARRLNAPWKKWRPRDLIPFYEYFHGDNGAGLGANHQTGWSGLVAKLVEMFGQLDAETLLASGKQAAFRRRGSE